MKKESDCPFVCEIDNRSLYGAEITPYSRVNYVFPEKGEWNGILLVGEAPGKEEVAQGLPFVGRSGKLLNQLLEEAKIERTHCAIANAFRIRPPDNNVSFFFLSKKAAQQSNIQIIEEFGCLGGKYLRETFAKEVDFLKQTIELKKPTVIVAIGRTAFFVLTGIPDLICKVGELVPCRFDKEIQVMPTYHPSYILRGRPELRKESIKHLLKATWVGKK